VIAVLLVVVGPTTTNSTELFRKKEITVIKKLLCLVIFLDMSLDSYEVRGCSALVYLCVQKKNCLLFLPNNIKTDTKIR